MRLRIVVNPCAVITGLTLLPQKRFYSREITAKAILTFFYNT